MFLAAEIETHTTDIAMLANHNSKVRGLYDIYMMMPC